MGLPQILLVMLLSSVAGVSFAVDAHKKTNNAAPFVVFAVIILILTWWGGFFG